MVQRTLDSHLPLCVMICTSPDHLNMQISVQDVRQAGVFCYHGGDESPRPNQSANQRLANCKTNKMHSQDVNDVNSHLSLFVMI